jgi:hypothetical protein
MSELGHTDDRAVSDLLTRAGFARSERTGREVGGFPEFSEGFTVSPDSEDSVLVMHDMSTGVRGRNAAQVRPMLDKYREALVKGGFAAEVREEPLLPLRLIVKRMSA